MSIDDKVCEQVSLTMLSEGSPEEVVKRSVEQSESWSSKARRVRLCTPESLVLFVRGMALWSRLKQSQAWRTLVGKLSDLHAGQPESAMSDSGLSGARQELGSQGLQALMRQCCQVMAPPREPAGSFL